MGSVQREALKWARTIHIYLSLSAFVMFLFFAVTGVLLTHDSFGLDQMAATSAAATLPAGGSADLEAAVRREFHITLPVVQVHDDGEEVELTFAGPARRAQVLIRRSTGEAEAEFEDRGWVGLLADLHKGAETGWVWRGLLDVISVWIAVSSITGILMLLALPKRRALGLLITVLGGLITVAAFAAYVPR